MKKKADEPTDQMDLFGEPGPPSEPEKPPRTTSSRATDRIGNFPFEPELAEHLMEVGLGMGRVLLAAKLATLEPRLSDEDRRALFLAVLVSLEAQFHGSTFVPLGERGDYLTDRLPALVPAGLGPAWQPEVLRERIEALLARGDLELVGPDDGFRPLVIDDGRLYHQRMRLHEGRLVEALADSLAAPTADVDDKVVQKVLDEVAQSHPFQLNDEQLRAVKKSMEEPLTIISGGPGTGKTSIIVTILRTLMRLGMDPGAVALAAPTGKAANRMAESIQEQLSGLSSADAHDAQLLEELKTPRTLHRLLGYSPRQDRFFHHEENPLDHQLVIVDEASMIDLFLMERLLRAVAPGARLVLLGDADQLPSVDTGAVLRDLIPEPDDDLAPTKSAAVRLQRSYRMRREDPAGRQILSFAQQVRDYDEGRGLTMPPQTPSLAFDRESWAGIQRWQPPVVDAAEGVDLDEFVETWFEEVLLGGDRSTWSRRFNFAHTCDDRGELNEDSMQRVKALLNHLGRARVLTLTRVYGTGSIALNDAFHRATGRLGRGRGEGQFDFHPGEPVMMLRNDYDRDLFNGDQGVVVWCRRPGEAPALTAFFQRAGALRGFPVAELAGDLEHAFAMTVHKAQGSEFEGVALILPERPMALLTRELLYTGITRASRAVLLVGSPEMVERAARNKSRRFSAVRDRLVLTMSARAQ